MNTLIAGGAGFIGSHLADKLIEEGNRVICVDNLSLGTIENIKHLKDNERFIFIKEDLSDYQAVSKIFAENNVEYVFHLAANSDIRASAENPLVELKNTLLTTFNILECMRLHRVVNLFFSSTSAIYGEKIDIAMSETSCPLEPISYYGSAKLASEAFINAFSYMNAFNTLVFRFPNVVGPRLTHGVIFDFINKSGT
jgi:UDP-glucose 4-epimerase